MEGEAWFSFVLSFNLSTSTISKVQHLCRRGCFGKRQKYKGRRCGAGSSLALWELLRIQCLSGFRVGWEGFLRHPLQVKKVVLVNIHSWLSPPRSLDQDLNTSSFRRNMFWKATFWCGQTDLLISQEFFFFCFFVDSRWFTMGRCEKMGKVFFQVEMLSIEFS